uniref:Protein expanded (inferred by orthology to a D. melanogaster protein) n=1 Tax=Strongyloides venezuelensis TaxID=75913 RepID=A0A0K0FL66_STRVS
MSSLINDSIERPSIIQQSNNIDDSCMGIIPMNVSNSCASSGICTNSIQASEYNSNEKINYIDRSGKGSLVTTPSDEDKRIVSNKTSIESGSNPSPSNTSFSKPKPISFLKLNNSKFTLSSNKVQILQNSNTSLSFGQKLISVYTLTKENILIVVDPKCIVWDVYYSCCQYLKIDDDSLLGLSIRTPSEGMSNDDKPRHEYYFLNPDQKLSKYMPKSSKFTMPSKREKQRPVLLLYLRIRVYIERIDLLTCDVSLQHYYLQLKENFLEHWNSQAVANEERCWQMAVLSMQADKIALEDSAFRVEKYFPLWVINFRGIDFIKKNIVQLLGEYKKMTPKESMIAFCQEASRSPFALNCHLYGVRRHKADVLDNTMIGICDKGIEIWDVNSNSERIPLRMIKWNKMVKLCFEKKKILISISDGYEVVVFAKDEFKARYLLSFCKEFHQQVIHINLQISNLGRHIFVSKSTPYYNSEIFTSTSRASSSITNRSSIAESTQSTSGVGSDQQENSSPEIPKKIDCKKKTSHDDMSIESISSSTISHEIEKPTVSKSSESNTEASGTLEATSNSSSDLTTFSHFKVNKKIKNMNEFNQIFNNISINNKPQNQVTIVEEKSEHSNIIQNNINGIEKIVEQVKFNNEVKILRETLDLNMEVGRKAKCQINNELESKEESSTSLPDNRSGLITTDNLIKINNSNFHLTQSPKNNDNHLQVSPNLEGRKQLIKSSFLNSSPVQKQRRYTSKSPSGSSINRVQSMPTHTCHYIKHHPNLQHQPNSADNPPKITFYDFFDNPVSKPIQKSFVKSNLDNIQSSFSYEYAHQREVNKVNGKLSSKNTPLLNEIGIKSTQFKEFPMMRALLQENNELSLNSAGSSPSATLLSNTSFYESEIENTRKIEFAKNRMPYRSNIVTSIGVQQNDYHYDQVDCLCNHCHYPSPLVYTSKGNCYEINGKQFHPTDIKETEIFTHFNPSDFSVNEQNIGSPALHSSNFQSMYNLRPNQNYSFFSLYNNESNIQSPGTSTKYTKTMMNTSSNIHHQIFTNSQNGSLLNQDVVDLPPPPPYVNKINE